MAFVQCCSGRASGRRNRILWPPGSKTTRHRVLILQAIEDRAPDALLRISGETNWLVWTASVGCVMQPQEAVGQEAIQLGLRSYMLAEPCRRRLHQWKISSNQIGWSTVRDSRLHLLALGRSCAALMIHYTI